jgi:hypothetical protein
MPLLAALFLLSGSGGWVRWRMTQEESERLDMKRPIASADSVSPINDSAGIAGPVAETDSWESPPPRTDEPEWAYDLFTPPTIYRQPETGEWLASLPAAPRGSAREHRHEELELLEVRRPPFRLQLVGFAGESGNFFGLFEDLVTTEHFLAAAGDEIPALGLKIERFRVIHEQGRSADETIAPAGLVAEALVRDEVRGETIVLTDREQTYRDDPIAVIGTHGSTGERFSLHRDEEIERGGTRYRLRDVRLVPPAVDLIVESPTGEETETWTLAAAAEGGS